MFAIILTFVLSTTCVFTTEIPSYIHICGRRNPNLSQCIIDSSNNLRNNLCQGIPEMKIPPFGLLHIPKLILSDTNNVKLYIEESQVMGLCNFIINDAHVDLDKLKLNFNITLLDIFLNSTYDFNIHVMVPIISKGQFSFTIDKGFLIIDGDLKMVNKNGKKYLYVSKIRTVFSINGFRIKLENKDSNQLQEIISNFIGNNEKELLTTFTPVLEETISKVFISTVNNMLKQFTLDELIPDRM